MNALTEADIASYVATGEPFDKAGAYAIQGWRRGSSRGLKGPYSNVVGLPVALVVQLLDRAHAAE